MGMLPGMLPALSVPGLSVVSAELDWSCTRRLASSRRLTLKCMEKALEVVFGKGRMDRSERDMSRMGFRRWFMRCQKRRSMIIAGVWWREYFRSSLSLWFISRAGVGGGDSVGDGGIALDAGSDREDKRSEISNEMAVRSI